MTPLQKTIKIASKGYKGVLILSFPPILLIVLMAALFVMMVSVCTKFTKGPLNTAAFLKRLQALQLRFVLGEKINPEKEREEMERLQNKPKATSDAKNHFRKYRFKKMLYSICKSIQTILNEPGFENRTSWIKLNALMLGFNIQYYGEENEMNRPNF